MSVWTENRFVITGGTGFLGSYVERALLKRGVLHVSALGRRHYDLRQASQIAAMLNDLKPTVVIHLAAVVGGIGANRARPAEFFYDNLVMGTELMHAAWLAQVKKFVSIGTVCAYPKFTTTPFREDDIWNGYPEETNAPYGLAKKMLLVQAQAYRQQYGFNAIHLIPTNLYGPGDNFDPATSHVIPALIRKCVEAREAGESQIVAWGTGQPTREFLFVEDAAEGIALATERYNAPEVVNLGSGQEISIRELVHLIAEATEFKGEVIWDPSQPDGQPRRALDVTTAEREFGFRAKTPFLDGLRQTVEWYLVHKDQSVGGAAGHEHRAAPANR